jgi:hypothetical protein
MSQKFIIELTSPNGGKELTEIEAGSIFYITMPVTVEVGSKTQYVRANIAELRILATVGDGSE